MSWEVFTFEKALSVAESNSPLGVNHDFHKGNIPVFALVQVALEAIQFLLNIFLIQDFL